MWNWVIRDYFAAFRWEKVKVWLKSGAWWYPFYIGIFMPFMLARNTGGIIFYFTSLPIMFCMVSEALHRETLPKIMFLCPMQREERMLYVERTFGFRMLFTTMIGVVMAGILWMMGVYDVMVLLLFVWNIWVLSFVFCGICNTKGTSIRDPKKEAELVSRIGGGAEGANMISSIISVYAMACFACWTGDVYIGVKLFVLAIALFVQLPLAIKTMKKWKTRLMRACSFERID